MPGSILDELKAALAEAEAPAAEAQPSSILDELKASLQMADEAQSSQQSTPQQQQSSSAETFVFGSAPFQKPVTYSGEGSLGFPVPQTMRDEQVLFENQRRRLEKPSEQQRLQAIQDKRLEDEGVYRLPDATQIAGRIKAWKDTIAKGLNLAEATVNPMKAADIAANGLSDQNAAADVVTSALKGGGKAMMDMSATVAKGVGMDETASRLRGQTERGNQSKIESQYVPEWVLKGVENVSDAATKVAAGGRLGLSPEVVFGADAYTRALDMADRAGLDGDAKYRYAAEQAAVNALLGRVMGKLYGTEKAVPAKTVLEVAKQWAGSSAKEFPTFLFTGFLSALSSKAEGVDQRPWTADEVGEIFQDSLRDSAFMSAFGIAKNKIATAAGLQPDIVQKIQDGETLSRRDVQKLGVLKNTDAEQRARLTAELQSVFQNKPVQPGEQPRTVGPKPSYGPGGENEVAFNHSNPETINEVPSEAPSPSPMDRIKGIEGELGRKPTKNEVAEGLGVSREEAGFLLRKYAEEGQKERVIAPEQPGKAAEPKTLPLPDEVDALRPQKIEAPVEEEVQGKTLPLEGNVPELLKHNEVPLESLTTAQLYEQAKAAGLKGFRGKPKPNLIDAIREARENSTQPPAQQPEAVPDRRSDVATRKAINQMTPEEMRQAIEELRIQRHTDSLTGLKNDVAYEESEKKPVQVFGDVDGLKAINDRFGHEAGNALLKGVAEAIREVGLEDAAYRIKGDEHHFQFEKPEQAHEAMRKLSESMAGKSLRIHDADGREYLIESLRMSHGIADAIEQAEAKAGEMKRERQAAGERELRSDWEKRFEADPSALPLRVREVGGSGEAEVNRNDRQAQRKSDTPLRAKEDEVESSQSEEFLNSGLPLNPQEIHDIQSGARNLHKALKALVAPSTVDANSKRTAELIREHTARKELITQRNEEAFKSFRKAMDKLPKDMQLDFIHRMETGQPQASSELTDVSRSLRQHLDAQRAEVRALGTGALEKFIEDYFPHIWKDPAAASNVMEQVTGKRPLEGSKSFLKQRSIPTIAEGIKAGLEPVTTNPVELVLLKSREVQRFIMGQRIIKEMKGKGLAVEVPHGQRVPAGYELINDKVARSNKGMLYAPVDVARVLNNYLSPGLSGNKLYDAWRTTGNALNQAQLGLSAFHLMMVGMESSVSQFAVGIKKLSHGRVIQTIGDIAKTPTAAFTTYLKGSKVLNEYLRPGSESAEFSKLVDSIVAGGGRAMLDPIYHNQAVKKFWAAVKDQRPIEAGLRAPLAALELTAKPLMEHFVPRMKLGVFAEMAQHELSKLPQNASREQVRANMAEVWDSVDNRMGQLVYDNLFWNKTLKDTLLASVRSVGWNLGTIREIGGGVADLASAAKDAASLRKPELTHRAAYTLALPFVVGVAGAVTHYLFTGRRPEDWKDLYFPSTGRKGPDGNEERVQLPSYMKDVFAYAQHPFDTLHHKLHPIFGAVADMLENRDFFGREIRNPNDPLSKQMQDAAMHVLQQFVPFSVRNAQQSKDRGQSRVEQVANFFGMTPAPRNMVRTDAQNLMEKFITEDHSHKTKITADDAEAIDLRRKLKEEIRSGKPRKEAIAEATADGKLRTSSALKAADAAKQDPRAEKFKSLFLNEAAQVMKVATPEEHALWSDLYQQKIASKAKTLARAKPVKVSEIEKWRAEVEDAIHDLNEAGVAPDQVRKAYKTAMKDKKLETVTNGLTMINRQLSKLRQQKSPVREKVTDSFTSIRKE